METIVKFFENSDKDNPNPIISRTLCKIAVVDRDWTRNNPDKIPKAGEFWRVRIVRETCIGMTKGCFIVHPLEQVLDTDLVHLAPGFFEEEMNNRVLVLKPKNAENYILPLSYKRHCLVQKNVYAIIVNLGGTLWPSP